LNKATLNHINLTISSVLTEHKNAILTNVRRVLYEDDDSEDLTLDEIRTAVSSYKKEVLDKAHSKSKAGDNRGNKYTYSEDKDLPDEDDQEQEVLAGTSALVTPTKHDVGWESQDIGGWHSNAWDTHAGTSVLDNQTGDDGGWGTSTRGSTPAVNCGGWETEAVGTSDHFTHEPPTDGRKGRTRAGTTGRKSLIDRKPTTKREQKIHLSKFAVQSKGILSICRESTDEFFFRHKFGDRLHIKENRVSLTSSPLDKTIQFNGRQYILIASKFDNGGSSKSHSNYSFFGKTAGPHIKSFYLAGTKESVQEELNEIANFSELWFDPGKLASRLELLLSPAYRGIKGAYQFELPLTEFEEVDTPENMTMGCGFIPTRLLQKLLGNAVLDVFAIQVRIISPHLGIFKGMLVAKQGISQIQLPQSMKKVIQVEGSKSPEKVYLLIKNTFPTKKQSNHERVLNPNDNRFPTKDTTNNLEGLNPSVSNVLLGCGVSQLTLQVYNDGQNSKDWGQRKHEALIGVSDCTNSGLPEGKVFITGWGSGKEKKVIVTRVPCTEMEDLVVIPVITEQPSTMSDDDWSHLSTLAFGAIMFASPKDCDTTSLPERVNNSDLDGDFFCVIWDTEIVRQFEDFRKSVQDTGVMNNSHSNNNLSENDDENLIGTIVPDGMRYVEEVLDHRGKGRKAEIEIRWDNGWETWRPLNLMKEEIPDTVAEYARANDLLNETEWKWAKVYIRDTEIDSILSHRFEGTEGGVKFEVHFDGDDMEKTAWINAKDIDEDLLAKYLYDKDISIDNQEWEWLKSAITAAKGNWLEAAQDHIADVAHVTQHDRFVKNLYALYKKRDNIHHRDTIALGRAYKKALDICKHGGRVAIPEHLEEVIASKPDSYAHKFLQIEGTKDENIE